MNKSESIAELAKALAAFQAEVNQPMKDANNPFFKSKYVPLENVVEAITETAPKHGLSFIQYPVNQELNVGIVTILLHSSGEYIQMEPIFAKPAKNDAQATGSVVTYLKRYSLSAVFGITSDEDDDGNSASQTPTKQQSAPKQQTSKPPSNLASQAQRNAIGAKIKGIAEKVGMEQVEVYKVAQDKLGIKKPTGQLTSSEASKVIEYLITQEG